MSAGINQAIETMSNLGNTFVDSYQKGLSMKMALEQNRRKKRKESFAYAKDLSNQYQSYLEKFGEPAAEQFLDHSLNSEQSKFYNIPKNWRPNPTGSALSFTGEEAMKQMLNFLGLEDNEKGREAVNSHLKAQGLTTENTLYFNVFGNNPGKFDSEHSQKKAGVVKDLQAKEVSLDKTKAQTEKIKKELFDMKDGKVTYPTGTALLNTYTELEMLYGHDGAINLIKSFFSEFGLNLSEKDEQLLKKKPDLQVGDTSIENLGGTTNTNAKGKTRTIEEVNKEIANTKTQILALENRVKKTPDEPSKLEITKKGLRDVTGALFKGESADRNEELPTKKDRANEDLERAKNKLKELEEEKKDLEELNNMSDEDILKSLKRL